MYVTIAECRGFKKRLSFHPEADSRKWRTRIKLLLFGGI